jgi:hypothetical protein
MFSSTTSDLQRSLVRGLSFVTKILTAGCCFCAMLAAQDVPRDCATHGGKWLAKYQECEYVGKDWCQSVGGTFNECASACRHSAEPLTPCTMQCVPVCSFEKALELPEGKDPLNLTYLIETQPVMLVDGHAERTVSQNSAIRITTKILEAGVAGDLNGDERDDVPLLLLQDPGGSGSFFYVAAALGTVNGFRGTNAVRIGDRVAPRGVQIYNHTMIVNYMDRYPWESFAAEPSVHRTRTFVVENGQLREALFRILSPAIARETVISKWGDCLPDTCKQLIVNVLDGGGGTWYVEATYSGMLDDSVRARRTIAAVEFHRGEWKIGDPLLNQFMCQPGRGHQTFSSEPCH